MTTNNDINSQNPLNVGAGGTGDSSVTAYAVLCAGTTSTGPWQSIAGLGSSGQVLTSNGASALPTFQNVGGSGLIAQVVTTTLTTGFSTTSSSYTAVTGLSLTITPSATSSTILILLNLSGIDQTNSGFIQLQRSGTAICVGAANGSNILATGASQGNYGTAQATAANNYLDSPSSTSSLTYAVYATVGGGGGTFYINEPTSGSTTANYSTFASTITALEILI